MSAGCPRRARRRSVVRVGVGLRRRRRRSRGAPRRRVDGARMVSEVRTTIRRRVSSIGGLLRQKTVGGLRDGVMLPRGTRCLCYPRLTEHVDRLEAAGQGVGGHLPDHQALAGEAVAAKAEGFETAGGESAPRRSPCRRESRGVRAAGRADPSARTRSCRRAGRREMRDRRSSSARPGCGRRTGGGAPWASRGLKTRDSIRRRTMDPWRSRHRTKV